MSFRAHSKKREEWSRYCDRHRELTKALDSIAVAFSTSDRFEELLQSGTTSSKDKTAQLTTLSDDQWQVFKEFVEHFEKGWESYFVETLYPAYFREVHRRLAQPK